MPPEFPPNAWIKCPCCNMHRRAIYTGREALRRDDPGAAPGGLVLLGQKPVPPDYFVSFRELAGGRGRGFRTLRTLTLEAAAGDPLWRVQVQSLVSWCAQILSYCASLGITPTE